MFKKNTIVFITNTETEHKIIKNVSYFHTGSYGCAAFCSTALKMFGANVKQVKVTNEVESQLKSLGWKAIADLSTLKSGDIVFTDKATSNVAGTWSHVYVFVKYKSAGTAIINDNNGKNIERNIFTGPNSVSKIAYRAP